jgi:hypothetical protein
MGRCGRPSIRPRSPWLERFSLCEVLHAGSAADMAIPLRSSSERGDDRCASALFWPQWPQQRRSPWCGRYPRWPSRRQTEPKRQPRSRRTKSWSSRATACRWSIGRIHSDTAGATIAREYRGTIGRVQAEPSRGELHIGQISLLLTPRRPMAARGRSERREGAIEHPRLPD